MVRIANKDTPKKEKKEEIKKENQGVLKPEHKNYIIIGLVAVAFIFGMLFTNHLSQNTIDKITSDNQETISSLQAEKDQLRAQMESAKETESITISEKEELSTRVDELKYYFESLNDEGKQTRREIKEYYEIEWDRFVLVMPDKEFTSQVKIESTANSDRDYNLEVLLLTKHNNPLRGNPQGASLTLGKGNSGTINLRFESIAEGYAIYGLYVNGHFAGEITVFVLN